MGYNPNKGKAPVVQDKPVRDVKTPQKIEDCKMPIGGLSVLPAGAEEYVDLGGLFPNKNKKGEIYFKVKDKEGNRFQITIKENAFVELVERLK